MFLDFRFLRNNTDFRFWILNLFASISGYALIVSVFDYFYNSKGIIIRRHLSEGHYNSKTDDICDDVCLWTGRDENNDCGHVDNKEGKCVKNLVFIFMLMTKIMFFIFIIMNSCVTTEQNLQAPISCERKYE